MKAMRAVISNAVKSASKVFGWDKKRSIRLPSGTPIKTQDQLVELWLSSDTNTARLILSAFKIGVEEGRRAERCGEPGTVLGFMAAFKQIMEALPDKDLKHK